MKINFSEIYEGWRNSIIPPEHLKKAIKEISKERMSICDECGFNSKNIKKYKTLRLDIHCTECGCTLSAKTKCLSCKCPLKNPKWTAVITEEQEDHIQINDDDKDEKENE